MNQIMHQITIVRRTALYNSTGATTHCGFVFLQPSSGAIASSRTRFLDHTQRRAKVGMTPLNE
jgi:hypothetical protein